MYPNQRHARPRAGLPRLVLALAVLALASLGLSATASAAEDFAKPKELTFLLQLRHPQGLAKFVRSVSDPQSPHYREYKTVEQIVHQFGAKPADKKATMQWLKEHGATGHLGTTGTFVTARMPAAVAAKALPADGATASSTGSVSDARRVPVALRGAVTSVSALDTTPGAYSTNVEPSAAAVPAGQEIGLKGTSIFPNTGTPTGCTEGKQAGISPAPLKGYTPNEYLEAFGHSKLHKAGFKGQGKSVAVIEIDGFKKSDINTFAKCFGLPAPNLHVRTVGIPKPLEAGPETTLDLEVLTATAPKLENIYVYEGQSSEAGMMFSVAAALGSKGHHPDAISISLGNCEADLLGQIAYRETMGEIFAVADGSGISVLVAAGDQGSTACERIIEEQKTALPLLSASDPASSPYVTAVGGTNIELTKQNQIKQETVWNDTPLTFWGGGGMWSILSTPRPWYQEGLLAKAGNGRLVPDVAGLADLYPGYAIYCTAAECANPELAEGGWETVGGTSAATPLYAGGVLIADGYQEAHGAPPIGFLNPLLYEVGRENKKGKGPGNVLYDVVHGNNDLGILTAADAGGGKPLGCCSANVGYDTASGWGSLEMNGLAQVATGRFNSRPVPTPAPAPKQSAKKN
jgi:subtilase family serine protease